jgi:hypothetical protein
MNRRLEVDPVTHKSRWRTPTDDARAALGEATRRAGADLFRRAAAPRLAASRGAVQAALLRYLDLKGGPEVVEVYTAVRLIEQINTRLPHM